MTQYALELLSKSTNKPAASVKSVKPSVVVTRETIRAELHRQMRHERIMWLRKHHSLPGGSYGVELRVSVMVDED